MNKYFCLVFQEVQVRFAGFEVEEDEWINVKKHVRQRSLPCEASECVAVLAGDLVLCFQVSESRSLLTIHRWVLGNSLELIPDGTYFFLCMTTSGRQRSSSLL